MRWDACNGDADGLCALHQWRLARPAPDARLVTGPKRDIMLLERIPAGAGDEVTVFDVSLARNRIPLEAMLARGAKVRWFDHHRAGSAPLPAGLEATIDESPDLCTALIVDREIGGIHRAWALVGAFGDALGAVAVRMAGSLPLLAPQVAALRELGEALNYNAYGDSDADLLVPIPQVYETMRRYDDPFEMMHAERLFRGLAAEKHADLQRALLVGPARSLAGGTTWCLPDAAWARRVSGTLANRLASQDPNRAFAVVTPSLGAFKASLRVPRGHPWSAARFCSRYASGGGRALAAGIDRIEARDLEAFHADFAAIYAVPVSAASA